MPSGIWHYLSKFIYVNEKHCKKDSIDEIGSNLFIFKSKRGNRFVSCVSCNFGDKFYENADTFI